MNPVRLHDVAVLGPAVVGRDVAHVHRLARKAAAPHETAFADTGVPSSDVEEARREARARRRPEVRRGLGVEQHDRAREAREVPLERARDGEQRLVERDAARDLLQDLGLVRR